MKRILISHWYAIATLMGLAALALVPVELVEHGPVLCTFRNLFGVRCPGCGLTRAFACLLHGRPADALRYNGLAFILLPVFSAQSLRGTLRAAIEIRRCYRADATREMRAL